jgi:hypothetical protein
MSACGCGAWSSALMEMECMEAETKGLREDLWRTVGNEANPAERKPLAACFLAGIRVLSIVTLIIMSSVLPISLDQDRPREFFSEEPAELLTVSEGEILNALKLTLSGGNKGSAAPYEDLNAAVVDVSAQTDGTKVGREAETTPTEVPRRTVAKVAASTELQRRVAETQPVKEAPEQREPSADDVISLIQVGQRALRVSERAVSVYP